MNDSLRSPDGVTFDARKPSSELGVTPVIIKVSQFQLVKIVVKIDVTVIRFIVGVVASYVV